MRDSTYLIHEKRGAGLRRVQIHLVTCHHCKGQDGGGGGDPSQECWHGPYDDLASARAASAVLPADALRSECRCIYRALEGDERSRVILEDLTPRGPKSDQAFDENVVIVEYPPARRIRRRKEQQAKPGYAAASGRHRSSAPPDKASAAQLRRRALVVVSVLIGLLLVGGGAFLLSPSVYVAELHDSSRPYAASFAFSNGSPAAITEVVADCRLDYAPAAVHLQDTHVDVADRLGSERKAPISCLAGSIPDTRGLRLEVTVSYKTLGIRQVHQKFLFAAGRGNDGIQRWMYLR